MNHRTQRILALLAEAEVGLILRACAEESRTLRDLEKLSGGKATLIKQRVELLEAFGLLQPAGLVQGTGRPANAWKATAVEELSTFQRQADDFARALARVTERMIEDETPAAPLRKLRVVQDDEDG